MTVVNVQFHYLEGHLLIEDETAEGMVYSGSSESDMSEGYQEKRGYQTYFN